MNKIFVVIIAIIVLLVIAAIGYAVWINYNSPQDIAQNQTPPQGTTPGSTSQASSPIVKTDSAAVPYISTVVVRGTVNPNGALTTYWYEYGESPALGSQTPAYLLGSGYVTLYAPVYITGLKANTNYYFKLTARNSFGTVSGTAYSFSTSTTPPPTGAAPTAATIAATDVARTSANLHGQVNPKGAATTFWFEYGITSNFGSITVPQSAGAGDSVSTVSASLSNLQPLTKYYFRVNAQNQFGTVNSQILSFTTKGPVAPAVPTVNTDSATAVTGSSAKLNGRINPNGAETTYWFEYSTNSLLSNILVLSTPEQSAGNGASVVSVSANISDLSSNTKYYVRLAARNQIGIVRGESISFTTNR